MKIKCFAPLCHAMKEWDVAIFHGQTSGVYAYV
jgi:hypothetical protein